MAKEVKSTEHRRYPFEFQDDFLVETLLMSLQASLAEQPSFTGCTTSASVIVCDADGLKFTRILNHVFLDQIHHTG